ncbi:MAG: BrnT family toxin [Xanthomonadales bacterium]|nr:BrnT family toxin [Xanthomonadales bacterium]
MGGRFQYHFEWDPAKAAGNRRKHGVGFELAATVFRDPLALSCFDEEHSEAEERWVTLGLAGNGRLLAVVHTFT